MSSKELNQRSNLEVATSPEGPVAGIDENDMNGTVEPINPVLERAKAEWEAAFDAISEGIAIVDESGVIRRVNRALAALLGRDVRNMVGLSCCDLFSHHRAYDGACPVRNYPGGKQGTFEVFFPDYRYYEDSLHPIMRGGNPQGYVITVKDVTRELMANQEKKHVYLQMEEVSRKRKLAEETIEDLSHELQSAEKKATLGVLASIIFAELNRVIRLLREGLNIVATECRRETESTLQDHRKMLEELLSSADRSTRILDKLGRLRVDEADANLRLDLNRIVAEVVLQYRADAKSANVALTYNKGDLPPAEGNFEQVRAVIASLVLNAIDATRDTKGGVTVTTRREGKYARIDVSDTGPGIEDHHLPQIFNPFFTTDPQADRVGLGLTICHAIVEGHHGHVSVDSEAGKGTTVTVLLPRLESQG